MATTLAVLLDKHGGVDVILTHSCRVLLWEVHAQVLLGASAWLYHSVCTL